LKTVSEIATAQVAVVDGSAFQVKASVQYDSASSVKLVEQKPAYMKYESTSGSDGLVVFSEIYYPKGWRAFVDGKESPMVRANYVLRAMEIPAGTHTIEMRFEPQPYMIGNKVTMASSWLLLIIVLGGVVMAVRKPQA
jgi:uncharacterized membrane protein YfhO